MWAKCVTPTRLRRIALLPTVSDDVSGVCHIDIKLGCKRIDLPYEIH